MRIVSSQGKGEKEKAQWVTASFFGKQGDLVRDLKKGDMIAVQGPLNVREYKTCLLYTSTLARIFFWIQKPLRA